MAKPDPGTNEVAVSAPTRPRMRSFEIVVVTDGPVAVVLSPLVKVAGEVGLNGWAVFAPETPNAIPLPFAASAVKSTVTVPDCADVVVAYHSHK